MRSIYQTRGTTPSRVTITAGPLPLPSRKAPGDRRRAPTSPVRRPLAAISQLLAPLVERTRDPGSALRSSPVGEFHHGECHYRLPRFVFRGPVGGGSTIRLGFFAALRGDEPQTALALRDFLLTLDGEPALAQGYELYAYPVCNPSGFEDGTRHSRAGLDLNREFWRGSAQPEVYYLERELGVLGFHGLVALHADAAADGCYAYVRGATLTEALARPALAAAAEFLPLAQGTTIDGAPARDGVISRSPEGVLCNPGELASPAPFEIIFETPGTAPAAAQSAAAVAALRAILREYRPLLAYGENL